MVDTPTVPESQAPTPEAVVGAFIAAMNRWELQAWEARRRARGTPTPESYWPEVTAALERVFAEFCTARKRKQDRAESFQKPPEYDPDTERIVASESSDDRAFVDTERQALLGGGRYRYTLHRKNGRWLVDNLQHHSEGKWVRCIL